MSEVPLYTSQAAAAWSAAIDIERETGGGAGLLHAQPARKRVLY